MQKFVEMNPPDWQDNAFTRIGKEWMLVTAGNQTDCNTMTASWGGIGVLWNKNVSFAFVRPSRYTYSFLEREDTYSLSFFGGEQREALKLCGSRSGRELDKIAAAGLTAVYDGDTPYFEQAELVLICKKLYVQDMQPSGFLDDSLAANYPDNTDYHRVYVGEIVKILKRG